MEKLLKQLLILLFILSSSIVKSQDVYVQVGNGDVSIYKFNSNKTFTLALSTSVPSGCDDIALSSDGTFYGIKGGDILELKPGNSSYIGSMPTSQIYTSLVCSNENELYSIDGNGHLTKFSLQTKTSEIVDTLEDIPAGDLIFHRGNLVFPSLETGKIIAYNLLSKSLATIMCMPGFPEEDIYATSNIYQVCSSEKMLAFTTKKRVLELNLTMRTIKDLEVDASFLKDYETFLGAAYSEEYLASTCPNFQYFDFLCFSDLNDNSLENISLFPNPVRDELHIKTQEYIVHTELFTLLGSPIKNISIHNNNLNLSQLPSGTYYLVIKTETQQTLRKIIKL